MRLPAAPALLVILSLSMAAQTPQPPTVAEILRGPEYYMPALSPSGTHFTVLGYDEKDILSLLIYDLDQKKLTRFRGKNRIEIHSYNWLSEDELVFNLAEQRHYAVGIYTVQLDRLGDQKILSRDDVTTILGIPRKRPKTVVVWMRMPLGIRSQDGGVAEIRTDKDLGLLKPGTSAAIVSYRIPGPGKIIRWMAGADGELALAYTYLQGETRLHRYDRTADTWSSVPLDMREYSVAGIDPDRRLWVSRFVPKEGFVLQRYDPITEVFEPPVWSDPKYNPGGGTLHFSPKSGALIGLRYEQLRTRSVWFDETIRDAHERTARDFPFGNTRLTSMDDAEQRLLLEVSGPQEPGLFILHDVKAKTQQIVIQSASWLNQRILSPMQAGSFVTRDGLSLDFYLTLPARLSGADRVPLVVLLDNAPFERNTWSYQKTAQYLALKGYAVLQSDYRGVPGYAPAISGESPYALRQMHADVIDATRFVSQLDMIDPARIAIVGRGIGASLAIAGVAWEPGFYRCAAAFGGIYDWEPYIRSKEMDGRPGEYERLVVEVGDPDRDQAALAKLSILNDVPRIREPVLVAHGKMDVVVPFDQTKRLVRRLQEKKIRHESILMDRPESHFEYQKDYAKYIGRVDAFLTKYLQKAP